MREVARSRNLLSGFVTTLKRLFESVVGTLFCLLLYMVQDLHVHAHVHVHFLKLWIFGVKVHFVALTYNTYILLVRLLLYMCASLGNESCHENTFHTQYICDMYVHI